MKKVLSVIAVLTMATLHVQAAGFGLFGSYWSTEDVDDAYGGGVKLGLDLGKRFDLELRGTYFDSFDVGDRIDGELDAIPVEAGVTFDLIHGREVRAYLGGGVGYVFLDGRVAGRDVEVDDEVGWYGVAGLEFELSDNVAIFGEAMYRQLEATVKDDDIDDVDELNRDSGLDGFGANVGVVLGW